MLKIILIITAVLLAELVGVIIFAFSYLEKEIRSGTKQNNKLKEYIKTIVLNSTEIEKKFKRQASNNEVAPETLNEATINHIVDLVIPRVLECLELEKKNRAEKPPTNSEQTTILYFKTKSQKVFSQETVREDALFEVDVNAKTFKYIGKEVVSSDFLTDVCEFANNPREIGNIAKITTLMPGKIFKNAEGNWEVDKPAKIEFKK